MNSAMVLTVGLSLGVVATVSSAGLNCQVEVDVEQMPEGGVRHARAVSFSPGAWVMVVGDYSEDDYRGAVAICEWSNGVPIGSWGDCQLLEGLTDGEQFGAAVAAASGHILVGVPAVANGVVDCFTRGAHSWQRSATLTPPAGWAFFLYGGIATYGDWAAIPLIEIGSDDAGVGLWKHEAGLWTHEQTIERTMNSSVSVDMDADRVIIGWPGMDAEMHDEGMVDVYELGEDETWDRIAAWVGDSTNGHWGQCVAIHGDQIAYARGGFYATDDDWPARVDIKEFQAGSGWHSVASWESDEVDQVMDISLDSEAIGVVIWGLTEAGSHWRTVVADPETLSDLSFVDPGGEGHGPRYQVDLAGSMVLYDVTLDDESRQARVRVADDCDFNGSQDVCDRVNSDGADLNEDGALDRCVCPGNVNPHVDNTVDSADIFGLLYLYWGDDTGHGDCDGDGVCDVRDLLIVLAHWGDCPV